ncbi:equilibrative nucleoside transporter 2 isoform X2 [Manis pentadactyla]|uniref:equilibrative nucleoside transporter 2 isoform X2 n=1 Tax=Manis pentadactyla TaxID=143292 RepID=UPI00255C9AB0|nr:equilibrative nucleoside transporter 2 isoform X2 [Manis pentadactyla]
MQLPAPPPGSPPGRPERPGGCASRDARPCPRLLEAPATHDLPASPGFGPVRVRAGPGLRGHAAGGGGTRSGPGRSSRRGPGAPHRSPRARRRGGATPVPAPGAEPRSEPAEPEARGNTPGSRFPAPRPPPFGETSPPPSARRPRDPACRPPALGLRRGCSYHLVGISFFILGLGTLLPWNFFITAIPYFQGRLVGANSTAATLRTNHTGPADTFNFNNWVTLLSQLPLLLFTLLNSFLYQCVPDTVRILGSLLVILLLFALTAALVKVDMSPGPFFSITMASVWFINSFCAVLQGSLFGQLGTMPSTYSTFFLSGQGLAGIFAALAMLTSMASGVDAQTSALGYFITPCVGILMSVVCYLSLFHLEFARYYLAKKPSQAQGQELETKAELLQPDEKNGIPNSPQKVALTLDLDTEKEPEEPQQPRKPSVFIVFQKIWLTALCLVLVFTVTLSVFPAITAMVTSSASPGKWSQFFNPICCFLLFNIMDWLGRSLTSYFLWVPAAHPLPTGCLLHHFHAAVCCFQRLPDVPHHVPGTQAGAAT